MKIFLDANALFSAGQRGGPTAQVVKLVHARAVAVTCDYAVEEARRNVELKRLTWLTAFDELIVTVSVVRTECFALPVTLAQKDVPILCSAIRAGCVYLVTSDKRDFGHLYGQSVQGVTIWSLLQLTRWLTRNRTSSE